MSIKKEQSKAPRYANMIALAVLIVSILANIGLIRQNSIVNERADLEAARANAESARADTLIKRKESWLNNLTAQLNGVKQRIEDIRHQQGDNEIGGTLTDKTISDRYNNLSAADGAALQALQDKEAVLENQINYFMANYN
jgi:hypothetical protein